MFLMTTHSSTILNAANYDEITVVKSGNNGTMATHLSNDQEIRDMLEENEFGLGDLWVSGAIGGIPGDE